MNQSDLAAALGVTKQAVSQMLNGQTNFTIGTLRKIENVLDIQLLTIGRPKTVAYNTEALMASFEKTLMALESNWVTTLIAKDSWQIDQAVGKKFSDIEQSIKKGSPHYWFKSLFEPKERIKAREKEPFYTMSLIN